LKRDWAELGNSFRPAQQGLHNEEKTMKRTIVLLACLMALTIGATAQNQFSFASLPLASSPLPVPNGYDGFNWSNFFYVDPAEWQQAGPGYKQGPNINQDVAFIGGTTCLIPGEGENCFGSISVNSSQGQGGVNNPLSFQLVSATVAGGFGPTSITVVAYNNGNYVGSASYNLTGQLQTINFPASWGGVTEVTFKTQGMGDLVLYNLEAYLLLG
jgi:hypothetical protein